MLNKFDFFSVETDTGFIYKSDAIQLIIIPPARFLSSISFIISLNRLNLVQTTTAYSKLLKILNKQKYDDFAVFISFQYKR